MHATLWDLVHLRAYVMLRCGILSTCAPTSCYAVGSSLALAHIRHATLCYFLLHLHTYFMLRCAIFFALAHIRHATLLDLLLHLHTYVMLRCAFFFRPGLFLAPALCLVVSNFDLNLLISTAALKLQLSKRCPTWPHPRHVRGIRSLTLSMLHSCKQSKVCSTWNLYRSLVLRSLKKPVPRLQTIDVSFHDSAKIS